MEDTLLTVAALGERWHVPKERILQWLTQGTPMPASFKIGAQRLFKLKRVVAFEDEMETRAQP